MAFRIKKLPPDVALVCEKNFVCKSEFAKGAEKSEARIFFLLFFLVAFGLFGRFFRSFRAIFLVFSGDFFGLWMKVGVFLFKKSFMHLEPFWRLYSFLMRFGGVEFLIERLKKIWRFCFNRFSFKNQCFFFNFKSVFSRVWRRFSFFIFENNEKKRRWKEKSVYWKSFFIDKMTHIDIYRRKFWNVLKIEWNKLVFFAWKCW